MHGKSVKIKDWGAIATEKPQIAIWNAQEKNDVVAPTLWHHANQEPAATAPPKKYDWIRAAIDPPATPADWKPIIFRIIGMAKIAIFTNLLLSKVRIVLISCYINICIPSNNYDILYLIILFSNYKSWK